MKQTIPALALAIALMLGAGACGSDKPTKAGAEPTTATTEELTTTEAPSTEVDMDALDEWYLDNQVVLDAFSEAITAISEADEYTMSTAACPALASAVEDVRAIDDIPIPPMQDNWNTMLEEADLSASACMAEDYDAAVEHSNNSADAAQANSDLLP